MRKIYSANPDWKISIGFFLNNHKYSNGPSELIRHESKLHNLYWFQDFLGPKKSGNQKKYGKLSCLNNNGLGFEIAANFGDCSILPFSQEINRLQRLAPFHSKPNLRSQNEVISELWIETAWCSFLSSSALLLTPLQLSSPPPLFSTAVRLSSSTAVPLSSTAVRLFSSTAVPLSSSTTAVPLSYSIANLPPKLHRRLIRHLTIHRTDSAHSRTDTRSWTPPSRKRSLNEKVPAPSEQDF